MLDNELEPQPTRADITRAIMWPKRYGADAQNIVALANEFSSIDCCLMYVSDSENWGEDSITASATLRCAWANRHSLISDILENRRSWPYFGLTHLRAVSGSIRPVAGEYEGSGQGITYTDADVTINYSTDGEDELITESIEPNTEFLTADYRKFRWTDDETSGGTPTEPLLENEAPGILLRSCSIKRTFLKVEAIPNEVYDLVGRCNESAYVSELLETTFPVETLLYTPPVLSRSITTEGAKAWNLAMGFMYKPQGWNRFYKSSTGSWRQIYSLEVGEIYKPYPPDDFSGLLFG